MRALRCFVAAGIALLGLSAVPGAQPSGPVVYTAVIDGIIHPVAVEYVRGAITRADAAHAALIVFTLRTPGGLVDSTRDINNAIIHAKTPVAVLVGPSGNRAASAGFLIIVGEHDLLLGDSRAMQQRIAENRFALIRNSLHGTAVWQPEAFTTAVRDFLALVDTGQPVAGERVL